MIAGAVAVFASAILIANAYLKVQAALQTIMAARTAITTAATTAYTVAQWLRNVALDANPIGVVVLALAALAAGLVIAWHYSGTFRSLVVTAFQDVVKDGRLVAGPLALFLLALKLAWDIVKPSGHIATARSVCRGRDPRDDGRDQHPKRRPGIDRLPVEAELVAVVGSRVASPAGSSVGGFAALVSSLPP